MAERSLIICPEFDSVRRLSSVEDRSQEMEELCRSAGLVIMDRLVFRQKTPTPALFIGRGKTEEISALAKKAKADVVVFENDLSSTQQRNLEERLGVKTLDRTQLILDIFAQRARSTEGKIQVELAQLQYLLPRLSGKGIYLSRLGGGVGTRGPGEQKLEVDRRRIRERITKLERELDAVEQRRLSGIERKKKSDLPIVALVGYTNAGKSTLFNALTRSSVKVENRLFSTLDTTTRLVELVHNQRALLVDTVGFVRELPHHLIEAFKATLEETVHADILLHVIDAERSDTPFVIKTVEKVLEDLGVGQKKIIEIFNKIDLLNEHARRDLVSRNGYVQDIVLVSARTGEGFEQLKETITTFLSAGRAVREFFLPRERLGLAHYLYEHGQVIHRRDTPAGSYFQVNIPSRAEKSFRKILSLDN